MSSDLSSFDSDPTEDEEKRYVKDQIVRVLPRTQPDIYPDHLAVPIVIEQYAQNVPQFSSQYGSDASVSYTAYNVTGKPSKYPEYGDFPETFAFRTYGHWWQKAPSARTEFASQNFTRCTPVDDFLLASFECKVYPQHIKIYETYSPGAIVAIWAYLEEQERWMCLWDSCDAADIEEPIVAEQARIFAPPLNACPHATRHIRLEYNQRHLQYFTQIDAILLVGRKNEYITRSSAKRTAKKTLELNTKTENKKDTEELESSLDKLPNEILFHIMLFLDLKSLYRCGGVCRRFQQIVRDNALFYTEINLRPYWHCATTTLLSSLRERCTHVKKLDLSWFGTFQLTSSDEFKHFLLDHGRKLTHLRLDSSHFINKGCVLKTIAAHCGRNLLELSLQNYTPDEGNFSELGLFENLERLDLSRTTVSQSSLIAVLSNNAKLRHLNLSLCPVDVNMDEVAQHIGTFNRKLVSLDLWKSHHLTSRGLTSLSQCTSLEELDLGWCLRQEESPGESLRQLIRSCPRLKKLFLEAARGLDDLHVQEIADNCHDLEQLDLLGSMLISTEACYQLLCKCHKLELLDLSFCGNLDKRQAILWMQCFNVDIKLNRATVHSGRWNLLV